MREAMGKKFKIGKNHGMASARVTGVAIFKHSLDYSSLKR